MKNLLILSAAMLTLSACATTGETAFGPQTSASDIGFENIQIEKDRFRVGFTGRSDVEASDFALLRAAQIAQTEGYSHFEVLHGNVASNGPKSPVSTSIGFGSSRYRGRGHSNVGFGIGIGDIGRMLEGDKVTHMIEVRLRNDAGDGPNIYNAQGIIDNIRPAVFK